MKKKKNAKQRMAKRRDRFVVGYIGPKNVLFAKGGGINHSVEPLTRKEAEKTLAAMPCADCAIFELVPVEVNR